MAFVSLTTFVLVFSKAVCFVVKEFALKYVAVRVEKCTFAICFSILPLTDVARIIWPSLSTVAMLEVGLSVNSTLVSRTIWHCHGYVVLQIAMPHLWLLLEIMRWLSHSLQFLHVIRMP